MIHVLQILQEGFTKYNDIGKLQKQIHGTCVHNIRTAPAIHFWNLISNFVLYEVILNWRAAQWLTAMFLMSRYFNVKY